MEAAPSLKTLPSPDLSPTACVAADSADACLLRWLPLAVRFKLDACGLRISLADWQRIPLARRAALLRAPLDADAGGFKALALACGAAPDARERPDDAAWNGGAPDHLRPQDFGRWLTSATPFARYVARKIALEGKRRETA